MRYRYTLLISSMLLLGGCAAKPPAAPPEPKEQPVDEVIVIQGARTSTGSAATVSVKPMSYDELVSCATMMKNFQEASVKHFAGKAAVKNLQLELEANDRVLERDRKMVNVKKSTDVVKYNKRVDIQRANVDKFNESVMKYNQEAADLNLIQNKINVQCTGRSFKPEELKRLPPDLQAAVGARTKTVNVPIKVDEKSGVNE